MENCKMYCKSKIKQFWISLDIGSWLITKMSLDTTHPPPQTFQRVQGFLEGLDFISKLLQAKGIAPSPLSHHT